MEMNLNVKCECWSEEDLVFELVGVPLLVVHLQQRLLHLLLGPAGQSGGLLPLPDTTTTEREKDLQSYR